MTMTIPVMRAQARPASRPKPVIMKIAPDTSRVQPQPVTSTTISRAGVTTRRSSQISAKMPSRTLNAPIMTSIAPAKRSQPAQAVSAPVLLSVIPLMLGGGATGPPHPGGVIRPVPSPPHDRRRGRRPVAGPGRAGGAGPAARRAGDAASPAAAPDLAVEPRHRADRAGCGARPAGRDGGLAEERGDRHRAVRVDGGAAGPRSRAAAGGDRPDHHRGVPPGRPYRADRPGGGGADPGGRTGSRPVGAARAPAAHLR